MLRVVGRGRVYELSLSMRKKRLRCMRTAGGLKWRQSEPLLRMIVTWKIPLECVPKERVCVC